MSFRCVASGFRYDMEELFSRFLKTEEQNSSAETTHNEVSLRFSRFSECWRQMNFSLVFRYRFHENDLREFIDETYLLVLPNVAKEFAYERRVCALYLLYSLFQKQPKTVCQKIRINFSYLEQFRELIQMSKQLKQLDVCFIWYKLCSLGAIDLVLVARRVGPSYIRNMSRTDGKETAIDFSINQFKTSVYPHLNELSQIHENYRTIKQLFTEDNPNINPNISKEFSFIEENIFEANKSIGNQMLKNVDNPLDKSVVTSDTNVPKVCKQIKENLVSDIGAKRRQLKERALTCKTNTTNESFKKLERRYGPITDKEAESRKKAKGRRGRPKVGQKWTA